MLKNRILESFSISKGSQNPTSEHHFREKRCRGLSVNRAGTLPEPPGTQFGIQTGPGTDFSRFWTDFGWILGRFSMDFGRIFAVFSVRHFSLFPVSTSRLTFLHCFLSLGLIFNGHFGNMLGYHFSFFPVSASELALFPFCVAWRSARGAFQ